LKMLLNRGISGRVYEISIAELDLKVQRDLKGKENVCWKRRERRTKTTTRREKGRENIDTVG